MRFNSAIVRPAQGPCRLSQRYITFDLITASCRDLGAAKLCCTAFRIDIDVVTVIHIIIHDAIKIIKMVSIFVCNLAKHRRRLNRFPDRIQRQKICSVRLLLKEILYRRSNSAIVIRIRYGIRRST